MNDVSAARDGNVGGDVGAAPADPSPPSRGRVLRVDDLVTDPACRSSGYGVTLLDRLAAEAVRLGCAGIERDSGTRRTDARRFYLRERFAIRSFHCVRPLPDR